ncbi:glycosyl transferase family 90 [Rhodoferax sp.]|uniref:glycosyl transferase family 90 n=1 Tax=Rhodoferax sp. TaxID=50421 RepID=UPI00261F1E16|nr:glycosyl transferase family 90 [Rhodoferax sp.]MDD2920175.1 glycosyl transferase family 90 [Rhodoferax sp.]
MFLSTQVRLTSIDQFESEFACKITSLPINVALIGWSAGQQCWKIAPESVFRHPVFQDRAPSTLLFLQNALLARLGSRAFWTLYCFDDGWRERNTYSKNYRWVYPPKQDGKAEWRGEPGEIPLLSQKTFRIACYDAHQGDPSALLLPESHYLSRNNYCNMFSDIERHSVAWNAKLGRAIYCGGQHGECANYFPPSVERREHPRAYLESFVKENGLPVEVHLGHNVSQSEQLKYKYILDVDGYVRTWDAWAWKMRSGSVILSQDSVWDSFFTRLFQAWVHYVPVANDFSDLQEKLLWCLEHDSDCRQMAQQADSRAREVYSLANVAATFSQDFLERT